MSSSQFSAPLPPPFNDRLLIAYYLNLAKAEQGDVEKHYLMKKWKCEVLSNDSGQTWSVKAAGGVDFGNYAVKEDALRRALCVALMQQDQDAGRIESIRRNLQERVMKNKQSMGGQPKSPPAVMKKVEGGQVKTAESTHRVKASEDVHGDKPKTKPSEPASTSTHVLTPHIEQPPKKNEETRESKGDSSKATIRNTVDVAREVITVHDGSDTETDSSVTENDHKPVETSSAVSPPTKESEAANMTDVATDAVSSPTATADPPVAQEQPPEPPAVADETPPAPEGSPSKDPPQTAEVAAPQNTPALPPTTPPLAPLVEKTEASTAAVPKLLTDGHKRKLDPEEPVVKEKKQRRVEMRDPVNGNVTKVFASSYNAAHETEIKATRIIKACQDGGGLAGGHIFRYHDDDEDYSETQGNDKMMIDGTIERHSTDLVASEKREIAVAAPPVLPQQPLRVATSPSRRAPPPPYPLKPKKPLSVLPVASRSPMLALASAPLPHNLPLPSTMQFVNVSARTQAPHQPESQPKMPPPIKHALVNGPKKAKSGPAPQASKSRLPPSQGKPLYLPKQRSTGPEPGCFDLSELKPVRKKTKPSLRPKKIIELVELKTGKVLVCFRGATDVCRALDMDRKEVTSACENYEKVAPSTFGTFTLRYAKPGHYAAYIYGDHQDDYKKKPYDNHDTLARRYTKTFEAEKAAGIVGDTPDFSFGAGGNSANTNATKSLPTATLSVEDAKPAIKPSKSSTQQDELLEDAEASRERIVISPSSNDGLDATLLCLVCQSVPPRVVFEPCYHSVLCFSCAEAACKTFCPVCRTPIQGRVHPKAAILVRPRIFSAYSFM